MSNDPAGLLRRRGSDCIAAPDRAFRVRTYKQTSDMGKGSVRNHSYIDSDAIVNGKCIAISNTLCYNTWEGGDIMSGKSWIYNHDKEYYEMFYNGYITAINDSYSAEKDYVNDTYNLCINCYTAENEALFGDIDLDGEVNVNDVTLLSNYLAELAALDDAQLYAADVDHDGNVSISDVMYLQFYLAELV